MPKTANMGVAIRRLNTLARQFNTTLGTLQRAHQSTRGTAGTTGMAARTRTATRRGKARRSKKNKAPFIT